MNVQASQQPLWLPLPSEGTRRDRFANSVGDIPFLTR